MKEHIAGKEDRGLTGDKWGGGGGEGGSYSRQTNQGSISEEVSKLQTEVRTGEGGGCHLGRGNLKVKG